MFFQAALLGGYLYAHLSTRLLGIRRQALLHVALLALAALALPVAIPAGWTPPASDSVVGWLLALLAGRRGRALPRPVRDGAPAPAVALYARPSVRGGSVRPLRREQRGQLHRAPGLPDGAGADAPARAAVAALDHRIPGGGGVHVRVRLVRLAACAAGFAPGCRRGRGDRPIGCRRAPGTRPHAERSTPLGGARFRAVEPAARGHRPTSDRRRGGSVAVGDSARTLPADVRRRLRPPRPHGAAAPGRAACAAGDDLRARALLATRAARALGVPASPRVVHDHGARPARGARRVSPLTEVPDRVLSVAGPGWRARRRVQRAGGAGALRLGQGVRADGGAGLFPPPLSIASVGRAGWSARGGSPRRRFRRSCWRSWHPTAGGCGM